MVGQVSCLSAQPLKSLGLSTRVYNALIRAGARVINDVVQLTDEELASVPWMPQDGPTEVLHALLHVGLTLSTSSHGWLEHMKSSIPANGLKDDVVLTPGVIRAADAWIADPANATRLREIAEASDISFCYLVGKLPAAVSTLQNVDVYCLSSALLDKMRWYAAELAADVDRLRNGLN